MCYTRTSSSSTSCSIPSCADLASGDKTKLNGFQGLTPAATAENPNPMGNGTAGSGSNLTFSSYTPKSAADGRGSSTLRQLTLGAVAALVVVAASTTL